MAVRYLRDNWNGYIVRLHYEEEDMAEDLALALYMQLRNLVEASKAVLDNWERGNLAAAVVVLDATQKAAEEVLQRASDTYEPISGDS